MKHLIVLVRQLLPGLHCIQFRIFYESKCIIHPCLSQFLPRYLNSNFEILETYAPL